MNNIFSFTEDDEAKEIFEKHLEEYNLENELYEEMLDTHKELFFNYDKKKEIRVTATNRNRWHASSTRRWKYFTGRSQSARG